MQSRPFCAPGVISFFRRISSQALVVCGLGLTIVWISFLMGYGIFSLLKIVI